MMKSDSMGLFGAWLIDMLRTFGLAASQGDKKADICKNNRLRGLNHMITEQALHHLVCSFTVQHLHVVSRAGTSTYLFIQII